MDKITPQKLLKNSFFLTHFLSIKYYNSKEEYETMLLDLLLFSISSHYSTAYNEAVIYDNNDEFLKRKYTKGEILVKLPQLASYYRNYQKFFTLPIFCSLTYCNIIQSNKNLKAEIFYKKAYSNNSNDKKAQQPNNKQIESLHYSTDCIEGNGNEENETVFDFTSRKTIENFGVSTMDIMTNLSSQSKNEIVLGNYYNNNIFNTKRSSRLDDSLIGILTYMNKKQIANKEKCRKNTKDINKNKVPKGKWLYLNKCANGNAETKPNKDNLVEQLQQAIISKKNLIITNNDNLPISIKATSHKPSKSTHKDINKPITNVKPRANKHHQASLSPIYSIKYSNRFQSNFGLNYNKNISKSTFNTLNKYERPFSRNIQSQLQSIISKLLSSNNQVLSKQNSPQKRKSYGLYKAKENKLIQQHQTNTHHHNVYFSYLNNCTNRLEQTTHALSGLLLSKDKVKEKDTKDKSISISLMSSKRDKTGDTQRQSSHLKKGKKQHQHNMTRNIDTPIFKNTLYSNYVLSNPTKSILTISKEYYERSNSKFNNDNNKKIYNTHNHNNNNDKIQVHLTINHTTSNLKENSGLIHTQGNIYKENQNNKNTVLKKKHLDRKTPFNLFTTYSNKNINTNGITINAQYKGTIELKKELKGYLSPQITHCNHNNCKKTIKHHYDYSLLDLNSNHKRNNTQLTNNITKTKDKIIVNRMSAFKSMKNSNYSNEKNFYKRNDKEKEDSTWSRSGQSLGHKAIMSD